MNDTEAKAYCIGFFDGEGTICISKHFRGGRTHSDAHKLRIVCSQREPQALLLLRSLYGGRVSINKVRGLSFIWTWDLRGRERQAAFLKDVETTGLVKRNEARIALEFLALIRPAGKGRTPRLTAAEMQQRDRLYRACKVEKSARSHVLGADGQLDLPVRNKAQCYT